MTRIVSLAGRGDGLGDDGSYHPRTAPGDVILVDGRVEQGPHHIEPVCRHFGVCGGCQLQHVDDEAYSDFLIDRINGALAAQGIETPQFSTPHISPPNARRRVSMHALRRGESMRPSFTRASSHQSVEIRQCPVMCMELERLLKPLGEFLAKVGRSRRRVEIQLTLVDQGIDLALRNLSVEGLTENEAMIEFAEKNMLARLSLDEGYGPNAHWEPEPVTVTLGAVAVSFPQGAFLQATADGEKALVGGVKDAVLGATRIADLFAGLGTFSFGVGCHVHAVEGARDAVLALQGAANRAGRSITTEHRDLFRRPLSAAELARFDAIILDPPRAGAKEQVAQIAASSVPDIAYVSCNPSTFARDAKALIDGGYRLETIKPVGQFRWSTHVELAAHFRR